jgi:hypothetical protein
MIIWAAGQAEHATFFQTPTVPIIGMSMQFKNKLLKMIKKNK